MNREGRAEPNEYENRENLDMEKSQASIRLRRKKRVSSKEKRELCQ